MEVPLTEFLTEAWARAAVTEANRPPNGAERAKKLDKYWDWVAHAGSSFDGELVLVSSDGDGEPSDAATFRFANGECIGAAVVDVVDVPPTAYVLSATPEVWRQVHAGYDAGRAVMYRMINLEQGNLLTFFNRIYWWVELVARLLAVPATFAA